jgi:hypothetical protein
MGRTTHGCKEGGVRRLYSSTGGDGGELFTGKPASDQHKKNVGGWCHPFFMRDAHTILEQVNSLLGELARLPVATLSDEQLCLLTVETEQSGRLIDSMRVNSAAEINERSRFELGTGSLAYRLGHARGSHLIEQLTRISAASAAARIRLGAAVRPRQTLDGRALPPLYAHVASALIAGNLGVDAAAQIVITLDQATAHTAHPEQVEAVEEYLVTVAAVESADLVAIQARVQREALDPDGAPQRDEQVRGRRAFRLGRESHGVTPFSGACDPVSAAMLRAAFAEANAPDATPRFMSDEDRDAATDDIPDPRTRDQRQHDVLFGLITAGFRSTAMRRTTTVMAVVNLADLESGTGVGWLDDVDEPVSVETIRELVCDAGFRTIVLGRHGEIIGERPLDRFFNASQRRALAVRDGGCVWPHCTAPPGWCDAHHVVEWHDGGKTTVSNGVLLCPAHHHMLHRSAFTMKMVDGRPRLLAPSWIDPDQRWRTLGKARVTMRAGSS